MQKNNVKAGLAALSGYATWIAAVAFAATIWAVTAFKESSLLQRIEIESLFVTELTELNDALSVPGGLLDYMGAFLTQFLLIPALGSAIWVALLLLATWITIKAFRLKGMVQLTAFIPALMLVLAQMSLGYAIFKMKCDGYFFTPVMGYIMATATIWAFRSIRVKPVAIALLVIWTPLMYAVSGIYSVVAALMTGLVSACMDRDAKWRIPSIAAGPILAFAVPLAMGAFYTTFRQSMTWGIGLPDIPTDNGFMAYRIPFMVILAYMVAVSVFQKPLQVPGIRLTCASLASLLVAACMTSAFWYRNENFSTELRMSQAVDDQDWVNVIRIFKEVQDSHRQSDEKAYISRTRKIENAGSESEQDEIVQDYKAKFFEPTRLMVMYRDLAMVMLGTEGAQGFAYRDGGRSQARKFELPMAYQAGRQLYLYYGIPNFSYRWSMENTVEYGWSVTDLKYAAMSLMVRGEWKGAEKLLDKLEKTRYHSKWAKDQKKLLGNMDQLSKIAPYSHILQLYCFDDELANDMTRAEEFLFRHFVQADATNPTPLYDRVSLFWAMKLQDIPTFTRALYRYLESNDPKTIQRHYQEAAILYGDLERNTALTTLPYDNNVKESYAAFKKYSTQYGVRNLDESRYIYEKKFGTTFPFFYYFTRNITTF